MKGRYGVKRIIAFLVVLLLLMSAGCGQKVEKRVVDGSVEFTAETLPKICATAYTKDAAVNVVVAALGVDSATALSLITVCGSSDECYQKLMTSECDIVLAHSYGIKVANELLDMPHPIVETELNKDALVFITNGLTGIEGLTKEQIVSLYKAEITDWKDVGGSELSVTLFGNRKNSDSRAAFERFFGDELPENVVNKSVLTEKGEFQTELQYDNRNGALGYTLLSRVEKNPTAAVKLMAVDGTTPTAENIESGKYPFKVSVLASMRGGYGENDNEVVFYRWLIGEQGRKVMGY